MSLQKTVTLVVTLFLIVLFQSCASSGNMMQSTREYAKDYNQMKGIVEQAIVKSNLNIYSVDESREKNEIILGISRSGYVNKERREQEKGLIKITKLSKNKTRITVQNPEYDFSVPNYERENYQRAIFNKLEDILAKN